MPSFRWWFTSQVQSSSGLFTQNVAAAWLILQQTGNGLNLAVLAFATANTLVQLRTGTRLRGRVMGVWVMVLPDTTR